MISIIISSYKEAYFEQVKSSINNTVGVPYEIVKIDNPGLYSITKAYNMGAAKAQYDILCFIHEDIQFHSENWGEHIVQCFEKEPRLGLIGIAGAKSKALLPAGWGHYELDKNKIHIIQRDKAGNKKVHTSFNGSDIDFVKVLDGVFLVTKKDVWKKIPFDESIEGYHLYDIDFSLRIAQEYQIAVTYKVLIEHFSPGNFSDDWIIATIKYHRNKDKYYLFDKVDSFKGINRSPYYIFLLERKISFKNRFLYVNNLGADKYSLFVILKFLFPVVGNLAKNAAKVSGIKKLLFPQNAD
ncbi:hypothetical protein HH214_17525 [Mucilaginibacter robiniae]|uniref:Streptomycin biosynthesis protein StrF domain-containing protein n=1 Tax=Mucilaginibacter robiniae TaxID=2728022 RepID=A0A7L5E6Y2_9SPHI|nr:glycosyltransferase [Mucilaginibacter robiniae]QJD97544.1 hypothetical protein HH214_17525 [Mucilaginibacter robiniae]